MKRIFSIILAVAMIMTMITVPASAAVNVTVTDTASTTNGGLFGKTANEYSMLMRTGAGDDNKANYIVSSKKDYDFSDSKYVVLDLNVAPTAAATYFTAGPNAGLYTLNNIRAFNYDQWNSVRVVLEEMTKDAMIADQKYQPMTMYVNGVKVAEGRSMVHFDDELSGVAGKTATYGKGFRFSVFGAASSDVAYFADAKISESNENIAPVMPTLDPSAAYEISGDKVVVNGSATVADLTAGTNAVRVYDNGVQITDTAAVLAVGNTVVVEDVQNKLYSYYKVSDSRNDLINIADGHVAVTGIDYFEGEYSTLNAGFGGNTSKIINAANMSGKDHVHWQYTYDADPDSSIRFMDVNTAKYLVIEQDVFAPVNHATMQIGSNQNTGFGFVNGLVPNAWNKVTLVVKNGATAENATARSTKYADSQLAQAAGVHKFDVYVNGTKVITDKTAGTFGLTYLASGAEKANDLVRFIYTAETDNAIYKFDDIYAYETDVLPADIGKANFPTVSALNSKLTVGAKKIRLNDATATKADLEGKNIIVYESSLYDNVKADDEALEIGNIVTAYNGDIAVAYTVADPRDVIYSSIESNNVLLGVVNATQSVSSAPVGGKTAPSVKFERAGNLAADKQSYFQVNYNKFMSIDTSKYVVFEMNYYPTDRSAEFSIGGEQSTTLIHGINAGLELNRWNKIIVVMENGSTPENPYPAYTNTYASGDDAKAASPHYATVYLNGNYVNRTQTQFGMSWNNGGRKEYFFRVLPVSKSNIQNKPTIVPFGANTSYIDDVLLYEADSIDAAMLTAMPQLPDVEGLSIYDSSIVLEGDVAVSALPEGATVYTDDTFTTKVTEGNLVNGYEVVYTDGVNVSYYTIEEDKIFADYSAYDPKWAKIDNDGTTSATTGINDEENGAYLVYSTSREDKPTGKEDDPKTPDKDESIDLAQHNGFFGLGTYKTDFFGERPYSIFSVDFKFEEDGDKIFFGSNQHSPISATIGYGHVCLKDGWNNLVCVINNETKESTTYLNGIASRPFATKLGQTAFTDIRLVVYDRGKEEGNANDASVPVATFDNIKVYASVTNPFAAPFTYEATADNVTFTACDYIKNGYEYVVIAAAYDENDNLVGNVAIGTDTVTIAKNDAAAYYRGYLWNSTTGLIPVTKAVDVK